MQNYVYLMYFVLVLIFGRLAWLVFKDIKEAKGHRQNRILMYAGIFVACAVAYGLLRMFASGPLSDLYFKLGGTVK